ncbi:ELMO domain-containing protein C isoform X2 [Neltuma alba]|uniref:ELMO domain-containing protein C isoform X2 n=1 Tax=Neltuma alba TaxID=207710 RepID=UPI0010A3E057|nr:ELMO domain-containing protein C-like isoform X2 [Prosopis alba]
MSPKILRRRLHHGDIDGKVQEHLDTSENLDASSEPLLEDPDYNKKGIQKLDNSKVKASTLEDIWNDERKKEQLHWTFLYSQLITQWAHTLANNAVGSRSLISRLLSHSPNTPNRQSNRMLPPSLSPLQEERLRHVQERLQVSFDGSRTEHQDALKQLWKLAFPDRGLPPLKSELWKEMGWQGEDPSTDFRGGGYISLENLIFFAQTFPDSFQRLLHKKDGTRADWEYPFAVAGINVSFMLVQMLDLNAGIPSSSAGIRFLEMLEEDEMTFDNLYCIAFQMMDAQWLAKHASYMHFNDVLKSTRTQLERELALEDITTVKDMPAYNLLR